MKNAIKFLSVLAILSLSALFFQGCYPNDDVAVSEYDIAVTKCAPDFSSTYQEATTYFLVDSVAHGSISNPDTTYDATLLDAVRKNMNGKGWLAVDQAEADVIIFCSAVNTDVYTYWYDYWYDYWYAYYPYYPYYTWPWTYGGISYSYSEGTAVVQMNYTEPDSITGKSPIIWVGLIDGVMNDTQSDIKMRINEGMEQCFNQSSYLER